MPLALIRAWSEPSIPFAACSRAAVCSEFGERRLASIQFLLRFSVCSQRGEQSRYADWVQGALCEQRSLFQSWFQPWVCSPCGERSQHVFSLPASIRAREFLLRSWSLY